MKIIDLSYRFSAEDLKNSQRVAVIRAVNDYYSVRHYTDLAISGAGVLVKVSRCYS